jgi:serine/threonine-protein kinase HipA
MNRLEVWWDRQLVGHLDDRRNGLTFIYESITGPMISVAMPPRARPYGDRASRPFFNGLLPEGETRRVIAYDLGMGNDGGDDFEMLAALGRDCAGALVICEAGCLETSTPNGHVITQVGAAEIAQMLRRLPTYPLGVSSEVRLSLPGVQPKLPLARTATGKWGIPSIAQPSTHIIKPPSDRFPSSVPNEVFCMKLARELGVSAAETDLVSFDGLSALVSTRFDRSWNRGGTPTRVHQEDACQALSILVDHPGAKYQQGSNGPSFAAISAVLDTWAGADARYELLDHLMLAVIVGNADFHGKNVSILHTGGEVELAPMYDVMSTAGLTLFNGEPVSATLGMSIGGETDVTEVGYRNVLTEVEAWGLRRTKCVARIRDLLERLPDAISVATSAVPEVPEERIEVVRRRSERLRVDAGRDP